ncbi:acetate/propionate family kinase [Naasia lichenicola]|uniref:Acetate kinase n=1 Tax=Naasia lichenicola TaxID=2565933 RepID=A0A4S4FQX2_9MICO|nr:acetate kinase [Naasia lichenicola]THG31816.1 acetate kinase [Naasia lichenicola]
MTDPSTTVLVVNSGSSSLKYQLIETGTEEVLGKGLIERIGQDAGATSHSVGSEEWRTTAPIPDHAAAFAAMTEAFASHGPSLGDGVPAAIGHRVVQGGARFSGPTIITEQTIADIDDLSALAPLHNPPALAGILAARDAFPGVPEVAIFDTAFHTTLPPAAYTYAIDKDLAAANRIRRYGFHGTSHKYVSERAIAFLGLDPEQSRVIVMHLGNGASACAVAGGRSVETSMGMTPLEGLVMGTRSGDVDPAVLFHLHRKAGLGFDELDTLLNRKSGLLGLSGSGDLRDVQARAESGDADAELALEVYVHQLKHYIGAYLAQLGGADAIVFTAGVGENAPRIRQRAVAGLEGLGIELDDQRNLAPARGERIISTDSSRTAVLVIPTNEELEIARQTASAL